MNLMKTLVIFDTNKVRSTLSGSPSYGSFEFSSEFNTLKSYIKEKGLSEFVDLAISSVAIQEVLQQKIEQFSEDIQSISQIRSRLSELPGVDFSRVSLPDPSFDCKEHLNPLMASFIRNNEFAVIDIAEEKFGHILKEVLKRAIERRSPFRIGRNSTDIGFKDVLIWESILNYGNYDNYDKVILFTGDAGFDSECKAEFESRVKKEIVITPSAEFLQSEIEEDYADVIQSKDWRDFVNTDYFKSYFNGELSKLDKITIDSTECKVRELTVVNYLDSIEEPEEETDWSIAIVTSVKGLAETDRGPKAVKIKARTYLDDTKGIQSTDFECE
jgi:hypothetical protein